MLFGILCTTEVIFKTARLKLADFLRIIRERNWAFFEAPVLRARVQDDASELFAVEANPSVQLAYV